MASPLSIRRAFRGTRFSGSFRALWTTWHSKNTRCDEQSISGLRFRSAMAGCAIVMPPRLNAEQPSTRNRRNARRRIAKCEHRSIRSAFLNDHSIRGNQMTLMWMPWLRRRQLQHSIAGRNPELIAASKASNTHTTIAVAGARQLADREEAELRRKQGSGYFDRIFDELGIETAVESGRYPTTLDKKRFSGFLRRFISISVRQQSHS